MSIEDVALSELATRPIALAGFMGVGKSSIGRLVARELDREFFESDALVVERLGTSISAAFEAGEEERFRSLEAAAIAELASQRPPGVIALGGGALGRAKTLELLLQETLLVHLYLPWERMAPILDRLRRGRPLLQGKGEEEVLELYRSREALYGRCHLTIELQRDGLENGCRAVLGALAPYGITPPERLDAAK